MQIGDAEYFKTSRGNDVIVSIGNGKIVLKDADGKFLNAVNSPQSTITEPTPAIQPEPVETVTPEPIETVQPETEYAYTSNSGGKITSYYQFWNVKIIRVSGDESIYNGEGYSSIIHYAEEMPPILYDDDTTDDKFYAKYLGKGKRLKTLEYRQCNADYQRREHVHLQQQHRLKICSCRYRSHR